MRPSQFTGHVSSHPATDDQVDYLLSAGTLGGSQRERIARALTASLRARRAGPPRPSWTVRAMILSGVAAAACLVWGTRSSLDADGFQGKGKHQGAGAPTIDVECLRASLDACPRDSILAFAVAGGAPRAMFVTAYLEPTRSGAPVWLLSNEPAPPAATGARGLLAHGARIPHETAPGTYSVMVVVSRRPLPRDEIDHRRSNEVVARAQFVAKVSP